MNIREKYLDIRLGWSNIAPAISFINFIMLVYITIKNDGLFIGIPINLLMVVFTIGFSALVIISGTVFRKKQLTIDSTLNYEQQREPAKTTRILFDDIHTIQKLLNIPISSESINRRQYMYDIEVGKYG